MSLFGDSQLPPGWSAGTVLDCTVRLDRLGSPVRREVLGVSLHSLQAEGDYPFLRYQMRYNLPMDIQQDIKALRLTGLAVGGGLDDVLDAGGTGPVLQGYQTLSHLWDIPPEHIVVCLGSADPGLRYQDPEQVAARAIELVDRGFLVFEVEDEPYRSAWNGDSRFPYSQAGESAYLDYLQSVYRHVKRVAPHARILVSVYRPQAEWWGMDMLARAQGFYDGIAIHQYQRGTVGANAYGGMTFQQWAVSEPVWLHSQIRQLLPYGPVYVTRWGSDSLGASGSPVRDGNIYALAAGAYRLMLLLEEPEVRYAGHWKLVDASGLDPSGKFLFVQPLRPGRRGFLYWLYYYFSRYTGRYRLDVEGIAPVSMLEDSEGADRVGLVTPVLATMSDRADAVYLAILNGSWSNQYSATIRPSGDAVWTSASGVALSHDDPDAVGVVDGPPDALVSPAQVTVYWNRIAFGLPPRSLVLLRVGVSV